MKTQKIWNVLVLFDYDVLGAVYVGGEPAR